MWFFGGGSSGHHGPVRRRRCPVVVVVAVVYRSRHRGPDVPLVTVPFPVFNVIAPRRKPQGPQHKELHHVQHRPMPSKAGENVVGNVNRGIVGQLG